MATRRAQEIAGSATTTADDKKGPQRRLAALTLALLLAGLAYASAPHSGCVGADRTRSDAFRTYVVLRLGAGAGASPSWNPRTTIPTLASFQPVRDHATRLGLDIEHWLFQDGAECALEACDGRWQPAVHAIAFPSRAAAAPSVAESVEAFNRHIRPLERAPRTRSKYQTHRLTILTWAIWKGVLPTLLPMSDDVLRAFIWDALAFEASLPVLKHSVDAIKAWHKRLSLQAPADGPGDYRRLTHSLSRFQPSSRCLKFPIHKGALKKLLLLPVPPHPPCGGVKARCPICWAFLRRWVDCLGGATATAACLRCAEGGALQSCDLRLLFDELAGYLQFVGCAAINIKVRKNDQLRAGHLPRLGRPNDSRFDLIAQLQEMMRQLGNLPRPGCTKSGNLSAHCPVCPPLFPRSMRNGEFDFSRNATSEEFSAMVKRGLGHVGFDTDLFSGISARKGGLSTAIEAGVPESILWMQSGHALDVAARRYVTLRSPALLYKTWEAFDL